MLKFGQPPYLECSSKGDKRFSAFYARIESRGNKSIEEIYQASKIFSDGTTGLGWRDAKARNKKILGRLTRNSLVSNRDYVKKLYSQLWDEYFQENPHLLEIVKQFDGFSDIFGQPNHCCQAEEIYRIRYEK